MKDPRDQKPFSIELKNGVKFLNYYVKDMDFQSLFFIVSVGNYNDPKNKEGCAHFVEHLVANSIRGNFNKDIKEFFELNGVDYDFGRTSNYYTYYSFSAGIKYMDIFDKILSIFRDLLFFADIRNLSDGFIENERGVITSEFNGRVGNKGPLHDIESMTYATIFERLFNLRNLSPSGTFESIQTLSRNDFIYFYNKFYIPKNVTIVSVGGMKTNDISKIIFDKFENIFKTGEVFNLRDIKFDEDKYFVLDIPTDKRKRVFNIYPDTKRTSEINFYISLPSSVDNIVLGVFSLMVKEFGQRVFREENGFIYLFRSFYKNNYFNKSLELSVGGINHENIDIVYDLLINSINDVFDESVFNYIKQVKINSFNVHEFRTSKLFELNIDNFIKDGFFYGKKYLINRYERLVFEDILSLKKYINKERLVCNIITV